MKILAGGGEREVRSAAAGSFLARHDHLIPLFFFLAFLAITLPGISWGAPEIWHPDEVVLRSIKALHGDWDYYEANFNHPFLPQNVMYLIGGGVMYAGLGDRGTDFLVIDSFTLGRFDDPYTCGTMQVECDFFRQLAAGGSAHYRLLADFRYVPPGFLPQVEVAFVNPEIWVYERLK